MPWNFEKWRMFNVFNGGFFRKQNFGSGRGGYTGIKLVNFKLSNEVLQYRAENVISRTLFLCKYFWVNWHRKCTRSVKETAALKFQTWRYVLWLIVIKIKENFTNKFHQLRKTWSCCFGMKQHNTTLHKVKFGKHDGWKIVVPYKSKKMARLN